MLRRRTVIGMGLTAAVFAGAGGTTDFLFEAAMAQARERVAAFRPRIVASRFGDLEYAEAGDGPPVLMIHGSGGGCDQALLFTKPMIEAGYRVIAPSRFGYLGSAMPDDPSPENQADALVDLLNDLGLDRVPVMGGSAGALSALAFAIRHPDRCTALLPIVPATFVPGRPPARPWSPFEDWLARATLQSDLLFWAAITAMPDRMIKMLLATDPLLLATASASEKDRVRAILQQILPVSQRARGLLSDMKNAGTPKPMALEKIAAPTMTISLEDDLYLTADAARHIAASVKGARSIIYPNGGHVWIGHNAEMFAAIDAFLKETNPP